VYENVFIFERRREEMEMERRVCAKSEYWTGAGAEAKWRMVLRVEGGNREKIKTK